ncbi:phytanoyl-CoA dioxygenase family protein [Roseibacillus persicicus]|uniref:phytanoyl-CoA dioxygenase family protein n=1 Tax=Roseibacillus persicicus TaxID=454148 RepID=UPI00280F1994|nr:phytanoyl-CoA dioxygenase family protein [Roseibacillus persicicus]MDQ8188853.1 phytanoyl-CoA dioxygenase family protein [Roseibacillus persicicus]
MNTELKDNGYRILRGVFSKEETEELAKFSNRVIDYATEGANDPFGIDYMKHRTDNGVLYDLYQRHPQYRKFAESSDILDAVAEHLGESIYLYVNSFLYKPGDRDNVVPWHQDFLSRPDESEKILAWISLDHATKKNGCLKVLPGSHKDGFREWYRVEGETHHDRIRLDGLDLDSVEYLELEPGDVMLFSNYVIHGSDQNSSDLPRRAYRVVYKALDTAEVPRGGAITLRGGTPDDLRKIDFSGVKCSRTPKKRGLKARIKGLIK